MQIKDIQRLIDNPLQPTPAEWAMDVEDVLSETGTATKETFNEQEHKEHPYMGNFHTHGLNEYNNQRELCIVMALPGKQAAGLLNHMGLRVANNETVFTEGIRTDILSNNMDVQLLSYDDESEDEDYE